MGSIDHLFILSDLYCAATGLAESTVSRRVLKGGARIATLRSGTNDIGVLRLAEAIRWFSANWPEGIAWPAGVERPPIHTKNREAA